MLPMSRLPEPPGARSVVMSTNPRPVSYTHLQAVHHVETFLHLTEHSEAVVVFRMVRQREEELGAAGVRILLVRERQRPLHVAVALVRLPLVGNDVTGVADARVRCV